MGERATRRESIHPALDRSLVDRARLGDLDAFEEIVRARMDAVYRLTFAILGDEADARDAAQETFVAAWRQIRRVRDADQFDAWLQRVTVNAARMQHRGRRRRAIREIPAADLGGRLPDAAVEADASPARIDAGVLDLALASLPVEQRTLLVLHHLEGRSMTEIAAILAIPDGTVKSRLHTARHALQRAIDHASASEDAS